MKEILGTLATAATDVVFVALDAAAELRAATDFLATVFVNVTALRIELLYRLFHNKTAHFVQTVY